jgi:hypothetical protein
MVARVMKIAFKRKEDRLEEHHENDEDHDHHQGDQQRKAAVERVPRVQESHRFPAHQRRVGPELLDTGNDRVSRFRPMRKSGAKTPPLPAWSTT